MGKPFLEKLTEVIRLNNSLVCVGLDSELSALPASMRGSADPQFEFNRAIIDATKDFVCAYKPNMAFYEAEGSVGLEALRRTIAYIPPHIPVILDAKRGDIGNTSRLYAKACFDDLGVDAVTLHGYMGSDTVTPFLEYDGKGVFVLVKTSNPSAVELEDIVAHDGRKLYLHVAQKCEEWNRISNGRCGAVVGATYPEDLRAVRAILKSAPILVPGVGAQGGDLQATLKAGLVQGSGLLINSSRGIIFASKEANFAERAAAEARSFRDLINSHRGAV